MNKTNDKQEIVSAHEDPQGQMWKRRTKDLHMMETIWAKSSPVFWIYCDLFEIGKNHNILSFCIVRLLHIQTRAGFSCALKIFACVRLFHI